MIISAMDCFYMIMIGVIFGFIIHLEAQVHTIKNMIEQYLGRRNQKPIKDIYKKK